MLIDQLIKFYNAATQHITWMGGITTLGYVRTVPPVALVYGASIAIDAKLGNRFTVTVTDGNAFAFANPTNPPDTTRGQDLSITIRNTSGGALGAGTFGTAYKVSGNVAATATGNNRTIQFTWNGTNWVEIFRTAADVAN